ncbi:MAG: phosphoribosylaminoimidazolesuccinocarboxamide synthase [Spirochaetes bacterium]|nr:phosphoribosylaminoimidazolesuccinocarboxamide synthase [Spirochaetota bacterium]
MDLSGFTLPNARGNFADTQRLTRGKVRDIYDLGRHLVIITTDRISAFDRVLSTIPFKGEILNRISLFWFGKTSDIIGNHVVEEISPRSVLVNKCSVIPVELVVRGYLTGSAWRDYKEGRPVSGIKLPEGMRFNEKFSAPVITPSTKEERGIHDEPVSEQEILKKRIVTEELWEQIKGTAYKLFARGSEIAGRNGLILVDTKYEFGLSDNKLILIDELHTPDSSRYWYRDTYKKLFENGEKQKKLDKEYLRQWLMERGFMGNGSIPDIPEQVRVEVAWRYIRAYETITGEEFVPQAPEPEKEKEIIIEKIMVKLEKEEL